MDGYGGGLWGVGCVKHCFMSHHLVLRDLASEDCLAELLLGDAG